MNAAPSISPPPLNDGINPSGIGPSGIWSVLWLFSAWVLSALGQSDKLSEATLLRVSYPAGRDGCRALTYRFRPARHQRRMMARRARGIKPVSRYICAGLAPLIPNSTKKPLTRTQYLERCCKLAPMSRVHIYVWHYPKHAFLKIITFRALNRLGVFTPKCELQCPAPLTPD